MPVLLGAALSASPRPIPVPWPLTTDRAVRLRTLAWLVLASMAAAVAAPVARDAAEPVVTAIVRATSSHDAASAVHAAGGRVRASLDALDAVAADLGSDVAGALAATGAVVIPDRPAHLTAGSFGPGVTTDVQLDALQPGDWWSPDAGAGVGVALVDTGVADTPDLAGRLVRGLDLSGDGDGLDHYGHGTFMAGLIAGDGAASATGPARHLGVAPGAHVVSVKVAGADGETTLVTVLEGIDWVIEHAPTYDIGVLSLSFGVEPDGPFQADPLSWAVESAWAHGITVVAAAGNDGDAGVTSPGRDPWVLTAGSTDPMGTAATGDDTVPAWSGHDDERHWSKPEVLAPGVSVVSLRAPGSTIDSAYPRAQVDSAYFRGSGTSMSTALTAGTVAALLQRHPDATPDDLKAALVATADPVAGSAAGAVDLAAADQADAQPSWWQQLPVVGGNPGERMGMPWTAESWSAARWSAARWSAARWSAARWSAARWSAARWSAARWSAARWSAARWSAARWSAARWSAARWSASRWSASRWSASRWSASRWSASRWSADGWGDGGDS